MRGYEVGFVLPFCQQRMKIIFRIDKRTKQEHYAAQQINRSSFMDIDRIIKNGFECAAFAGALGMMVFWADIVTGLTG